MIYSYFLFKFDNVLSINITSHLHSEITFIHISFLITISGLQHASYNTFSQMLLLEILILTVLSYSPCLVFLKTLTVMLTTDILL